MEAPTSHHVRNNSKGVTGLNTRTETIQLLEETQEKIYMTPKAQVTEKK